MRIAGVIHWTGCLFLTGFIVACNPVSPERTGELAAREAQADLVRLQEFIDLLHKEIDQLHRDKERLAELVGHLKGENAALASAATGCKAAAIPTSGSKGGHRGR